MERKRNSKVTKRRTPEAETPLGVGDAQTTVSPQPDQSGARQNSQPTPDDIRQLAYEKWEAAGKPPGDGSEFWLQAEKELLDGTVVGGSPVRRRRSHTGALSGSRIPPDAVQHRQPT
jgi:hypothetical protein